MAERAKAKKEDGANSLVANLTTDAKRQKALEMAMEQIEKQFGKGAIMRLGQSEIDDIEAISTGSLSRSADGSHHRNLRSRVFR